jgi:hypothetical protein
MIPTRKELPSMKPSRRLCSKSLLIVSILALVMLGTTFASAKPGPFVPLPGSYSGTSTTLGQHFETKGGVHVHKGHVSLNVSVRALLSCADGSTVTLDQGFTVKPKGKTFGIRASGASGSSGYYYYDLEGKFTSKSAFSGTLSVEGDAEIGGICSGASEFSLKKG